MPVADKDYYLDADRQPTTNEADAAFIIARKGAELTPEQMRDYPHIKGKEFKEEIDPAQAEVAKLREAEAKAVEKQAAEAAKKSKGPAENK